MALVWKCMYNTVLTVSLLSAVFITFLAVIIISSIVLDRCVALGWRMRFQVEC